MLIHIFCCQNVTLIFLSVLTKHYSLSTFCKSPLHIYWHKTVTCKCPLSKKINTLLWFYILDHDDGGAAEMLNLVTKLGWNISVNRLLQRKSYIWSYRKYFQEVLKIFELWKIVSKSFQCQFGSCSKRCVTNFRTQMWTQILLWGEMFPSWHKSQPSLPNSPDFSSTCSPLSTSILFGKVLNSFYPHVPLLPVSTGWNHIWQMKHANDKKGEILGNVHLNIWTKLKFRLIRFKHGNMCQPHQGAQPPLCRAHTIPHQKHLLRWQLN